MGQTLSEPITDKHTTTGEDDKTVCFGASSMQGWRISMEDAHTTIVRMPNVAPPWPPLGNTLQRNNRQRGKSPIRELVEVQAKDVEPFPDTVNIPPTASEDKNADKLFFDDGRHVSFFGVYDGHGGQTVARYTGQRLHWKIAETEEFKKSEYSNAMTKGFLEMDTELRDDPDILRDPSGCTAITALICHEQQMLYVANAGDSRAVLSVSGKAEPLSYDHKPTNPSETARIVAAGGFVEFGRVNGNLALSRAIGDFEFKQAKNLPAEEQVVTCNPDLIQRKLDLGPNGGDEFIVLACDGIWDVLSNQDVVTFCRTRLAAKMDLGEVCEQLMDRCLAPDRRATELGGIGCDNMTVIIVALLGGLSKDEWYTKIASRVEKDKQERGLDASATSEESGDEMSMSSEEETRPARGKGENEDY